MRQHRSSTKSKDAHWSERQRRAAGNKRSLPVPPAIGSFDVCWCGQPYAHEWPGQKDGAPHPRPEP